MIKIDQTVVHQGNGNCQQAVIASLLDLKLEEVPNFIEDPKNFWHILWDFMEEQGYSDIGWEYPNAENPTLKERLEFDGGWEGYFPATVPSQTFEDRTHAVIIDNNLKVVHDPNPNKKALKCKPEDIINVIVKGGWYIDSDRNIVKDNF